MFLVGAILSAAWAGATVVPTREVAGGETLRAADVEWVNWPDELADPDLIADPDAVVGRVARTALLPGEPLREARLYPRGHAGYAQSRRLVTLPLARPSSAWGPGTHVDLMGVDAPLPCVVAQRGRVLEGLRGDALIRDGGVPAEALRLALPLHDAARLEHEVASGRLPIPIARSDDDEALASLPRCDVLAADRVDLPPGGWAVRVDPPATEIRVDAPERLDVVSMGDASWWHLLSRGDGPRQLVFERGEGDPVLLDVVPVPATGAAGRLNVPVAGALVLPLGAEVVYAHAEPAGAVEVVRHGHHLMIVGRTPASVEVTVRAAEAAPRMWTVDVIEGWPTSREPELVVRAGRTRAVRLDQLTAEARVATTAVAEVLPPRGRTIRVKGLHVGRTTLALFGEDGTVLTLRVVVVP